MANNFAEQLLREWYEYQGYFVRNNVWVGKRDKGGYETELDIVAFHPVGKHVVHLEPSTDADSWDEREKRYSKKFEYGRKYIPELLEGLIEPGTIIDQYAVLVFASKANYQTVGGGKIKLLSEFISEIFEAVKDKKIQSNAISEQMPLLRTLQFVCQYREDVKMVLY
ncbi:MAG: hypothetical protein ACM3YE_12290 [Bacteroidota bacterium]